MKKLIFALLIISSASQAQVIPPTSDSASRYITNQFSKGATYVFTKNQPGDSLNRLQVAMKAILLQVGQGGGSGSTTVAMRSSGGFIQVQYNGAAWENLITLADITGSPGAQGPAGAAGADGAEGREIELSVNATHIQWRYAGSTYANLIALSEIRGSDGADGSDAAATTNAADLITGLLSNDRLQNIPLNKLAQSGAINGSVIKWNGTEWAIGTDNVGEGGSGATTISADSVYDGANNKVFTAADETKLAGIAAGATVNSTDAALRDRSTHTGTQAQSTITNLVSDLAARLNISDTTSMLSAYQSGLNGKQPLNSVLTLLQGLTPQAGNVIAGVSGAWASRSSAQMKIVWGLDQLTNTSDANKPVSTAQQTALDLKANQSALVDSAAAIRADITGGASVTIDAVPTNGNTTNVPSSDGTFDALALKAPLASPTFTGTPNLPTGTIAVTQSNTDSSNAPATTAFVKRQTAPAYIGFGLDYVDSVVVVDSTSQPLKDFIALYGGGSSGTIDATLTDGSTNAIQNNAVFDGLALKSNLASPIFTGTPAAPTPSVGTNTTQIATSAMVTAVDSKNLDTTANISGAATKASATWATGTVTVNSNTQRHDILMTATGARTLVVSNINTVRSLVMWIDNTSGATVTLTLPANSFLQNTTTGIYASAASVVIAQGKTVLTLSNYDGTNYWFNY